MWKGAARAEFPGIPNLGHTSSTLPRKLTPRGKILSLSEASRRNLQSHLATLRRDVPLITCALTCPGFAEHLEHAAVKVAFLRFLNQLSAKSSRDAAFRSVSGFWKQELQTRNALHFHLLLAGLDDANSLVVRAWIVKHWVRCMMDIPGMPIEIQAEEHRKMTAFHSHATNWEAIRGEFHAYFAKYLGKDDKMKIAEQPIPGRWWGRINPAALPLGEKREIVLPDRVGVVAQRIARKIRQTRADNAKFNALCRKHDMFSNGRPSVSRLELLHCFNRLKGIGGLAALHAWDSSDDSSFRRVIRAAVVHGSTAPLTLLLKVIVSGDRVGSILGGYKFPPAMKFAGVRLIGTGAPALFAKILTYAGGVAMEHRDRNPF